MLKYHFPERNRIISGIARAVVVVEAPEKSGALITADFALEQGRDLYIHGRCIDGRINGGCRRLQSEGAETVYRGSDIFDTWGLTSRAPAAGSRRREEGALLEKEMKGEIVAYAGEYYEIKNG